MDSGFAIVGVLVAALAIWLIVRVVNRRERWAIWIAAALFAAIVDYPLSFGPACWLAGCGVAPMKATRAAYWPLVRIAYSRRGPPLVCYAELFSDNPNIVNNLAVARHAPGDLVFNVEELIDKYPATVRLAARNPDATPESN